MVLCVTLFAPGIICYAAERFLQNFYSNRFRCILIDCIDQSVKIIFIDMILINNKLIQLFHKLLLSIFVIYEADILAYKISI